MYIYIYIPLTLAFSNLLTLLLRALALQRALARQRVVVRAN